MSLDSELEELVQAKAGLEARMERQEARLRVLDAHKRTLVKALVSQKIATYFPVSVEYSRDSRVIEVADAHPFYILNIGKVALLARKEMAGNGPVMPLNYKILRRFAKTSLCRAPSGHAFYTTTVLSKNGGYAFLIKDDENNTWKGAGAFADFSSSFSGPIPFKSIEEWLGLQNKAVQELLARAMDSQPLPRVREGPSNLDAYFSRKI